MVSIPDAVMVAAAGGTGIVIVKLVDVFMSRHPPKPDQQQLIFTRQKELDTLKDGLIGVFQEQVEQLRENTETLIKRNEELYEENIKLKYSEAQKDFEIKLLRDQLGRHHVD